MRLNKNMYSLNIFRAYSNSITQGSKALNNISTGKKINCAKDNPNKVGQNENLKITILSGKKAEQNIQDTNSMIQTFDGSMQEMNDILSRMKQLTVQASNGALSSDNVSAIQDEIDQLKDGFEDIVNNTEFNGVKLSDETVTGFDANYKKSLIGAMEDENIDIPYFNLSTENLGISDLDMSKGEQSNEAVDKAINMVSRVRGSYGAIQNRLETTAENLSEKNVKLQEAQSNIGDADIAKEMLEYSTAQILTQSAIGLIKQSNNFPQDALNILGNIK